MTGLFTPDEAWAGGSYELAIELGEPDDEVLLRVLKVLWQYPDLTGCYLRMDVEPEDQSRLDPSSADLPNFPALPLQGCLRGIAALPNGVKVASGSDVAREEGGADWLFFGVPMGSLATAYPVGAYPFDDGGVHTWCGEIDGWLAKIGRSLFERVPFRLGVTGWDACSDIIAAEVKRDGIPEERWVGFLWPEERRLTWYPPTRTGSHLG